MEMASAMVATLRDEKITRFDNYEDRGEALRAAGLAG
jgi:ketosteroid isomerase-like protein